jgi:hypothetical protein
MGRERERDGMKKELGRKEEEEEETWREKNKRLDEQAG